jgi:hypothetical protein
MDNKQPTSTHQDERCGSLLETVADYTAKALLPVSTASLYQAVLQEATWNERCVESDCPSVKRQAVRAPLHGRRVAGDLRQSVGLAR